MNYMKAMMKEIVHDSQRKTAADIAALNEVRTLPWPAGPKESLT